VTIFRDIRDLLKLTEPPGAVSMACCEQTAPKLVYPAGGLPEYFRVNVARENLRLSRMFLSKYRRKLKKIEEGEMHTTGGAAS
jgi:hypothetical protein